MPARWGNVIAHIITIVAAALLTGCAAFDQSGPLRQRAAETGWVERWIQTRSATFDLNDSLASMPSSFKMA